MLTFVQVSILFWDTGFLSDGVLACKLSWWLSERVWESSYLQLITGFSLGDRMTHHWINNILSGCILIYHKHKQHSLVTYEPLVYMIWRKLVSSDNQRLLKCPYLWQDLHWNFLAGHWKPSMWFESPHFWHLSLFLQTFLASQLFFQCLCLSLVSFLWLSGPRLHKGFSLLVHACWEVCMLMPH